MAKLTDTQLIVLSKAAARQDGVGAVPPKMSKAAAAKVGLSLVAGKLMREIRSKPEMPIWREDEDGRRVSLLITRAGRDAIGVEQDADASDRQAAGNSNDAKPAPAKRHPSGPVPRPGSKQGFVVEMLSKEEGATLEGLVEATGWLPHTTRAALTRLRKRGYTVERTGHETRGSLYGLSAILTHQPRLDPMTRDRQLQQQRPPSAALDLDAELDRIAAMNSEELRIGIVTLSNSERKTSF